METKAKKPYMKVLRIKDDAPVENVGVAFLNPSGTWNLVIEQPVTPGEKLKLCPPKPRTLPNPETQAVA